VTLRAIIWEGKSPPTDAELRAMGDAIRLGKLRAGDRARPGLVNPAPNVRGAKRAYKTFHWGNEARRVDRTRVPDFSALYELGQLVAVEYETSKGDEHAIWVHKFSRPRPRLTATPSGRLGPIIGGRAIVTARGIER